MTHSSWKNRINIVLRHEIFYVCISKGSSLKLGNICRFTVLVRGKFYSYTFLLSRNSIFRKVPMKNLQLESDGNSIEKLLKFENLDLFSQYIFYTQIWEENQKNCL